MALEEAKWPKICLTFSLKIILPCQEATKPPLFSQVKKKNNTLIIFNSDKHKQNKPNGYFFQGLIWNVWMVLKNMHPVSKEKAEYKRTATEQFK